MSFNTQQVEEVSLESLLWAKNEDEPSPETALEEYELKCLDEGITFDDFIDLYLS